MTEQDTERRELVTLRPDEFNLFGDRPAPDGLTRRILARSTDTVIIQGSIPPRTDVPPHGLPAGKDAILAVLAGQVELGLGSRFETGRLKLLESGSMALFRPDDPQHYARTGDSGAEILVVAFAPEAASKELAALLEH